MVKVFLKFTFRNNFKNPNGNVLKPKALIPPSVTPPFKSQGSVAAPVNPQTLMSLNSPEAYRDMQPCSHKQDDNLMK